MTGMSKLTDQMKTGAEKIGTKNGGSHVATITAQRRNYCYQVEHERIYSLLIEDAREGLADVTADNVKDARSTQSCIKGRCAAKALR
jgi:phage terminase large subunit